MGITVYDLDPYRYSNKNGLYGGAAGSKDGININGQNWLVKYPKNTKSMRNIGLSYTTTPLCEFLGSHIFSMLGFRVHETLLGVRNGKVVVACKDFTDSASALAEIRTIKNHYNEQLSEQLEIDLDNSGSAHGVDLESLIIHIRHNPILNILPDIESHFFKQAVVDIYINNSDRNNGNWGLIRYWDERPDEIAPIYDNGGSFHDKLSEEKAKRLLSDRGRAIKSACWTQTAYKDPDGHIISCRKFLNLQEIFPELRKAIISVVPAIKARQHDIVSFIQSLPETVLGKDGQAYEICGANKKELFCLQLESRLENMLVPALDRAIDLENGQNRETADQEWDPEL